MIIRGNDADPSTDPAVIDALRNENPWSTRPTSTIMAGGVRATRAGMTCDLVRLETIKRRTTRTLPGQGFRYQVDRGQKSIKGQNGPAA